MLVGGLLRVLNLELDHSYLIRFEVALKYKSSPINSVLVAQGCSGTSLGVSHSLVHSGGLECGLLVH